MSPSPKKPAGAAKKGRRTLGGPELKMPSLRKPSFHKPTFGGAKISAPAPLAGVVGDLRERGLLPVVLVLVAAIIAVPLLLSNGEKAPAVEQPASGEIAESGGGTEASVVVADQSGVRDYKKRLAGGAKDPFIQPAPPQPVASAADSGAGTGTGSGAADVGVTASAGETGGAPSGGGTSSPQGATSTPAGTTGHVWLTHTVDLYAGAADAKDLKLRRGLQSGEVLPNDKTRIAAFTGVPIGNPNQAWFVLSGDVELLHNDGKCALGGARCEIIALQEGDRAKLRAFGDRTYVIKVDSIDRKVITEDPK